MLKSTVGQANYKQEINGFSMQNPQTIDRKNTSTFRIDDLVPEEQLYTPTENIKIMDQNEKESVKIPESNIEPLN